MFPTKIRFTGLGLSHNTSAAIFGGTAPMMGMILEKLTNNQFAIGYYVLILAIVNLIILRIFYKETYHQPVTAGKVM